MTTDEVVAILGGEKILRRKAPSSQTMAEILRQGLPYRSLEAVMEALDLSRDEVSRMLSVPLRTLVRRKQQRRLRADESNLLYRLAGVLAHTIEIFGTSQKAAHWLRRPKRALGGDVPLELLDTEISVEEVDQILGRIEHGVYS